MSDPRAPYVVEDLPSFEPGPEQPDPNPLRSRCIQAQDEVIRWADEQDDPATWQLLARELVNMAERVTAQMEKKAA